MADIIKFKDYEKMSNVQVLRWFGLRNAIDRRVMRINANELADAYDCEGVCKILLSVNGVEYVAPRRKKNERRAGYISRLRDWMNSLYVQIMYRNSDGDILKPYAGEIKVIIKNMEDELE